MSSFLRNGLYYLKHYVYHEIFWLHRQMLCLKRAGLGKEMETRNQSESVTFQKKIVSNEIEREALRWIHISLYDDELYRRSSNF